MNEIINISPNKAQAEQGGKVHMNDIMKKIFALPNEGDLIHGKVVAKDATALFVDIGPFGTGTIYGREYINAKDIIKNIRVGDTVTAKVMEQENEDGYLELSLREAKQAAIWKEAESAIREKNIFTLSVKDANKGGVILEWQGVVGFLPASQLSQEHYPRVSDGDKDKIMEQLKKLIGEKLEVSIITADPTEDKLIFSEKRGDGGGREKLIEKYHIGDVTSGVVTGTVDFGIFLEIEEGLEGLVHISEIDWSLVEDPRKLYKVGETVSAKIIDVKSDKISLSIKALNENPWVHVEKKYKKGNVVKGVVIKFNRYGALVSIEEGVAGLVHISLFGTSEKLHEALELGMTYDFEISLFEPKDQKLMLVLPGHAPPDQEELSAN